MKLTIVDRSGHRLEDDGLVELVAPGVTGMLGVLPSHIPCVTELGIGVLTYWTDGRVPHRVAVSGGFMEVIDDHIKLLARTAEAADKLDEARARAVLADIEAELETLEPSAPNYEERIEARDRAKARIEAIELAKRDAQIQSRGEPARTRTTTKGR